MTGHRVEKGTPEAVSPRYEVHNEYAASGTATIWDNEMGHVVYEEGAALPKRFPLETVQRIVNEMNVASGTRGIVDLEECETCGKGKVLTCNGAPIAHLVRLATRPDRVGYRFTEGKCTGKVPTSGTDYVFRSVPLLTGRYLAVNEFLKSKGLYDGR